MGVLGFVILFSLFFRMFMYFYISIIFNYINIKYL